MTIQGVIPRYLDFSMNDTPLDMKKKIFKQIKNIFSGKKVPSPTDEDQFDLWINKNIVLMIKDNTPFLPSKSGNSQRKAECEFCGRRHNYRDDVCEICTKDHPSGNKIDNGARLIRLKDLYAMLKYERTLRFEVMINKDLEFNSKALGLNKSHSDEDDLNS